jgi:protein-L-isoaspartate(D-aspartate) O-methyltransferase
LHIHNVRFHHGDGHLGWPVHAPYDGILVTAAPEAIPEELLRQLADGGRLVMPVGGADSQQLLLITRDGKRFRREQLGMVKFVPMLDGKS